MDIDNAARTIPDGIGDPRQRVIDIVESFPEGVALPVAGLHLSLEVRGKRFGWFMENHHGDERLVINCKAHPGMGQVMVEANADVYHIPKMAKNRGWGLGIWLDVPGVNWGEIRNLLFDAYEIVSAKALKGKRKNGLDSNSRTAKF